MYSRILETWQSGNTKNRQQGRHNMEVRAVDSVGGAQEAIKTNTHPDGAGAYQTSPGDNIYVPGCV
jgi:hypothetical protein